MEESIASKAKEYVELHDQVEVRRTSQLCRRTVNDRIDAVEQPKFAGLTRRLLGNFPKGSDECFGTNI